MFKKIEFNFFKIFKSKIILIKNAILLDLLSKFNESTDTQSQDSFREIDNLVFAYSQGSNNSSSRSSSRCDYSSHHGRHVNGSEWTTTRKYTGATNVCRWITIFTSNERRTVSAWWCTSEMVDGIRPARTHRRSKTSREPFN